MQTCKYSREDLPPPAGCCCSQKHSQSLAMVTRMPAVTRCSCGQEDTPLILKGLWINKQEHTGGAAGPYAFSLPCLFLVSRAHCWGAGEGGHPPLGFFTLSSSSTPSHQTFMYSIHSDTLGHINLHSFTHTYTHTHTSILTYQAATLTYTLTYIFIHMPMLTFIH